ncbi:MAG: hypothetical protein ABI832_23905 [bacterium]
MVSAEIIFGLWLLAGPAATFGLWLALRCNTHERLSRHALTLTALATSAILAAIGWWVTADSRIMVSHMAVGQTNHDTYYVLSKGRYLSQLALIYLPIALALLGIERLGPSLARRIAPALFAALQTGVLGTVLIQVAPPVSAPLRYVDYSRRFTTLNQISTLAAALAYISLLLLVLLLTVVLIRTLLRQFR